MCVCTGIHFWWYYIKKHIYFLKGRSRTSSFWTCTITQCHTKYFIFCAWPCFHHYHIIMKSSVIFSELLSNCTFRRCHFLKCLVLKFNPHLDIFFPDPTNEFCESFHHSLVVSWWRLQDNTGLWPLTIWLQQWVLLQDIDPQVRAHIEDKTDLYVIP